MNPSATSADSTRPPADSTPSLQLSRSALIAQGLALLSFASAYAGSVAATAQEQMPVLAVGCAAAFAFVFWSITLACRALWRSEPSRWPSVVLALFLLECGTLFALSWVYHFKLSANYNPWALRMLLHYGFPVVVPVGCFTTLIAAPLARRIALRRAAQETPSPQRGKLIKRGVCWYAVLMVLLLAVLLPIPFYLYCIDFSSGSYLYPDETNWQNDAAYATPEFLSDATETIVAAIANSSNIHRKLIYSGTLSVNRLEALLNGANPSHSGWALTGLLERDDDASLRYATLIVEGKRNPWGNEWLAARVFTRKCSTEQIVAILNKTPNTPFSLNMTNALVWETDVQVQPRLIPIFKTLIATNAALRDQLMSSLARNLPTSDLEVLWTDFLKSNVRGVRRSAAKSMYVLHHPKSTWYKVASAILSHPNPAIRLSFLNHQHGGIGSPFTQDGKPYIAALLKLLDDPDVAQRRGALFWLKTRDTYQNPPSLPTGLSNEDDDDDEPREPETEEERKEIDAARESALEWLKRN